MVPQRLLQQKTNLVPRVLWVREKPWERGWKKTKKAECVIWLIFITCDNGMPCSALFILVPVLNLLPVLNGIPSHPSSFLFPFFNFFSFPPPPPPPILVWTKKDCFSQVDLHLNNLSSFKQKSYSSFVCYLKLYAYEADC